MIDFEAIQLRRKFINSFPRIKSWRNSQKNLRSLARDFDAADGTKSSQRINSLLGGESNIRYLEIGTRRGFTLEAVRANDRVGVDPEPLFDTKELPSGVSCPVVTSDDFFSTYVGPKFDFVFLDGLHDFRQTYRDLINSIEITSDDALILIDDVLPSDEISSVTPQSLSVARRVEASDPSRAWHGDVFRIMFVISKWHPELEVVTIVTPGNAQAIVRKRPDKKRCSVAPEEGLALAEMMEYRTAFCNFSELTSIYHFEIEWRAIEIMKRRDR